MFPFRKPVHSYREAFEEMTSVPVSPTRSSGGKTSPVLTFPVLPKKLPQLPGFNMCNFSLPAEITISISNNKQDNSKKYYGQIPP